MNHIHIPGDKNSASITVKLDTNDNNKPLFSHDCKHWHPSPIKWHPTKTNTNNLTITFNLDQGISGLCTSSDRIQLTTLQNGQVQAVVTRTSECSEDKFSVVSTNGTPEDPKIVVNPQ